MGTSGWMDAMAPIPSGAAIKATNLRRRIPQSLRKETAATAEDQKLESSLSTAEQIGVLEDAVLHGVFFGAAKLEAYALARSLVGTLVRRTPDGAFALAPEYFEYQTTASRSYSSKFVDLFGPPRHRYDPIDPSLQRRGRS